MLPTWLLRVELKRHPKKRVTKSFLIWIGLPHWILLAIVVIMAALLNSKLKISTSKQALR